jgi:endonuclease YncB( thermonuclease family)
MVPSRPALMKPFIRYTTVLTLGLIAGYLIRDWQARNPASSQAPRCIRVLDGDTIEVAWDGETNKVRLIGIDAPETRRGPKLTTYAN